MRLACAERVIVLIAIDRCFSLQRVEAQSAPNQCNISALRVLSACESHGRENSPGSMRNGMSHRSIEQVLTHLGAWVLDRPVPPELIGQCCDRLRPAPIGEELRAALRAHNQSRSELVEWHWDQRLGRADGWLWQNGVLQQFRWWRRDGRLVVRAQLRCTGQAPLQLLD